MILMDWKIIGTTLISLCLKDLIRILCQVLVLKVLALKLESNSIFYYQAIKKMENSLLRMYLINACTNSKQEKVQEFFEKLGSDLQHQLEWKDWFGKFQIQFFIFLSMKISVIFLLPKGESLMTLKVPILCQKIIFSSAHYYYHPITDFFPFGRSPTYKMFRLYPFLEPKVTHISSR